MSSLYLVHHGIKGQKWDIRRWQNEDGSVTPAGALRYYIGGRRTMGSKGGETKPSRQKSSKIVKSNGKKTDIKKIAKTAAIVAGSALAVYGAVKLGKIADNELHISRKIVDSMSKTAMNAVGATEQARLDKINKHGELRKTILIARQRMKNAKWAGKEYKKIVNDWAKQDYYDLDEFIARADQDTVNKIRRFLPNLNI